MNVLLDMNIPREYTELLKQRGFNAVYWADIGSPNALDEEIMCYAEKNNFIVMTFDLDFCTILSNTHKLIPSVVQLRCPITRTNEVIDLVVAAMLKNKDNLENGAILSVDKNGTRLRALPI